MRNRTPVAFAVLTLLVSLAPPAFADPSVTPNPKDPGVVARAQKQRLPAMHQSKHRSTMPNPKQPSTVANFMCRLNDPVLPMFGCRRADAKKPGAK